MAISSQLFASTDVLIRPGKAKFYPLDIPVPHPQLRHLVSTVDQNWIYFVSSYDLYAVHLPSRRKSLLLTLPFSPRCLVAGLGWVCVGGEQNGISAFVRLDKDKIQTQLQVEDRSAEKECPNTADANGNVTQIPELVVNELGGSIVNSITLHELSNVGRGKCNEPVALVSNNDTTVKIYSLLQQKVIADLHHPFPINYALISPDSKTLVAVGDSSQAYFYRTKWLIGNNVSQGRFHRYEWEVLTKATLNPGDQTIDDHSFSVTFSPSGHLCAISAQGGMISVFDMESIDGLGADDPASYRRALVCSFTSSRSGGCGFVRSMAFSPAPWDLLAWAEDHGRAGLADVRQFFRRRQILELDPHAPDIEKVVLDDMTDPRLKHLDRQRRTTVDYQEHLRPDSAPSANESLSRRPEIARRFGINDLDLREQSVLDTLEVTMGEVEDAMDYAPSPFSVNYRASPHLRRSGESEDRSPSRAHLESLIDVFRERNLLRNQGGERANQPRRRSSVVLYRGAGSSTNAAPRLAPASTSRSRFTASPVRMAEDDAGNRISRLSPLMPTNSLSQTFQQSDSTLIQGVTPSETSSTWIPPQPMFQPSARSASPVPPSRLNDPSSHQHGSVDGDLAHRHSSPSSRLNDRVFAHTSTLPTTLSSAQSQAGSRPQSSQPALRRAAPLSEFETERQNRRSAFTAMDAEARDSRSRARPQGEEERQIRVLEARIQARQRLAARELEQLASSVTSPARASTSQRSELHGRATPEELIRLARQMVNQSSYNLVDGNGNWMPGEALEQILRRSGNANGSDEDVILNEVGIGTSGLGWSQDGRQLYVGTEDGILSYAINTMDRKFFPAIDPR